MALLPGGAHARCGGWSQGAGTDQEDQACRANCAAGRDACWVSFLLQRLSSCWLGRPPSSWHGRKGCWPCALVPCLDPNAVQKRGPPSSNAPLLPAQGRGGDPPSAVSALPCNLQLNMLDRAALQTCHMSFCPAAQLPSSTSSLLLSACRQVQEVVKRVRRCRGCPYALSINTRGSSIMRCSSAMLLRQEAILAVAACNLHGPALPSLCRWRWCGAAAALRGSVKGRRRLRRKRRSRRKRRRRLRRPAGAVCLPSSSSA